MITGPNSLQDHKMMEYIGLHPHSLQDHTDDAVHGTVIPCHQDHTGDGVHGTGISTVFRFTPVTEYMELGI